MDFCCGSGMGASVLLLSLYTWSSEQNTEVPDETPGHHQIV